MLKNGWIIIVFLCSALAYGQAEVTLVKEYSKMDGIHYPFIHSIGEDSNHFLWIVGDDADALNLNNHRQSAVLQRLSQNSIHTIPIPEVAQKGKIRGLYFMIDGQLLVNIRNPDGKSLLLPFAPKSCRFSDPIFPDVSNKTHSFSAIFPFQNEALILGQKNKEITLYKLNSALEFTPQFAFFGGDDIYNITESTVIIPWKEYCLISNRNMPIFIFDWEGNQVQSFEKSDFNYPAPSISGKHPWIDEYFVQNGTYYFFLADNPQLYKLDQHHLMIEPVKGAHLETDNFEIIQDPYGNTIIASNDKGELSFNQFNGETIVPAFKPMLHDEGKLETAYSSDLKQGIWVTFSNSILYYISFPKNHIKTYLPNASIRSILQEKDDNYLVVTDNAGWFNLDLKTDVLTPYTFYMDGIETDLRWTSNLIRNDDVIWTNANTAIKQVNLTDKTVKKSSRYYPALCLAQKNDSTLIYGTTGYQLVAYNINEDSYTALLNTDSLSIFDLEIADQLLFGATNKGLLVYDFSTRSHQLYQKPDDFPDQFIISITKHPTYKFLLGTKQGYLIAFDPENETFQIIYKDKRNAAIATILMGENEDLWINTFNGIVQFNPATKVLQRFSTADGLSHNEANRHSALKTENGMFVGTVNGLNYIKPNPLNVKIDTSELLLLSVTKYNPEIKAYDQTFDRTEFNANNTIELEAEHRALSLDFGLKNGLNDGDYHYEYQLNNEPWVNLKREQSVHFPNLEPGNYKLKIRALNFANEEQGAPLLLTINAKNFFYKTGWFYLIIGLVILFILVGYIRQQKKKRKTQVQFSRDLITTQEKERNRIAKELHDGIGQQLSLIKRKSQNANQSDISELAGNTLEEVRSISRNLYPALLKEIGLTESIRELANRYDEETELFFTIDLINIDTYFNQEQALNIYRFTQEALNNCIKYAQARAINIQIIQSEENTIALSIEDNGIGFDVDQKQSENTLGLKTLRERISILKGTFEIRSTAGKGTLICALIPLGNE